MITQTYNLNMIPSQVPLVVHCSRYDSLSRTLSFNIYNGDVLYAIPSGSTATIRGTKPDKTGFEYSCSFSGSIISVNIQQQMTVIAGKVECEIRIVKGNEILGTANFILQVEKSALDDDTEISETDLPLIEEATEAAIKAEAAAVSAQEAAKEAESAVEDAVPEYKSISISTSSIVSDSTYTEYSYKFSTSWSGMTSSDYVDCEDEISYEGAYALESGTDTLNIYFASKPSSNFSIDVTCWKRRSV